MTASIERTTAAARRQGTMMNFIEDAPVKKGSVLLTRMESITAYKNQHGQPRFEQSDTPVSANDMCSLAEWPSHARRNRGLLQDGQMGSGRYTRNRRKSSQNGEREI
ncbi:uncharacterized protein [Triticum aestivum]|uniref:uncharacterized protein isoform X2 n=1 Tax=Triticum aestivum TaxID=4565 RepID=UPI001D01B0CC|nr:uncharacterized protein LOC123152214 isoform X2 [Triticum aestivum]